MRGPWPERAAVAAALLLLLALLLHGLRADGLTNDEVLYIGAGWRQVALGDYRLNTTHPPLAPELNALGLLTRPPRTPPFTDGDDVLAWCYRFLHVENVAADVIARARVVPVLLTVLLALLCWAWAREVAGARAGALALGLFAVHPTLVAHGHLATTDLPAAAAMAAASWCFWRWTRRPALPWAAAVGAALGLALATRLTAMVLLPCFAVLALARIARAPAGARGGAGRQTLWLLAAALLLAPAAIWGAYRFQGGLEPGVALAAPAPDGRGPGSAALAALQRSHLLPAAYVESVRFQLDHNRRGHLAYLLGRRSRQGWPHYFVVAFLVKSTPGWLALLALAAAATLRSGAAGPAPRWHWLLPAAGTFAALSAGHIQIGERYLLPVHVYLLPWAAAMLADWTRAGPRAEAKLAAVLGALVLHAGPGLAATPQGHLAYFNFLAGGSAGGHRVLLDSNLDWGQDLARLAEWMRRRGVASVQLGYMGADDPGRFGIAHEDLPGQTLYPQRPAARPFSGTVVASPNLVYGLVPSVASAYTSLRDRPPDDRAGVFLVYRFPLP